MKDKDRRAELLKEYEFCQKTAQSMESNIWQTSAAMGIGLIGTFIFLGTRGVKDQPTWQMSAIIGGFIFAVTLIWWFTARRWWSVQHAMFMRMRHIEEELDLHSLRYIQYLDHPDRIPKLGIPLMHIKEIEGRARPKKWYRRPEHQKAGVQEILKFFPWVVAIAWLIYTYYLFKL
jgi:hypothetical protein